MPQLCSLLDIPFGGGGGQVCGDKLGEGQGAAAATADAAERGRAAGSDGGGGGGVSGGVTGGVVRSSLARPNLKIFVTKEPRKITRVAQVLKSVLGMEQEVGQGGGGEGSGEGGGAIVYCSTQYACVQVQLLSRS